MFFNLYYEVNKLRHTHTYIIHKQNIRLIRADMYINLFIIEMPYTVCNLIRLLFFSNNKVALQSSKTLLKTRKQFIF